ncbi:MAG: hypothetical protein V2I63_05490 [Pseudomonadales bacterium]|nr:hypothetical protein [Pseudomonadales bacterium]
MSLSTARGFTTARPGEDWAAIAARVLPDEAPAAAVERLKSWNLHLFMRQPTGQFLGSDVIFTSPPAATQAPS